MSNLQGPQASKITKILRISTPPPCESARLNDTQHTNPKRTVIGWTVMTFPSGCRGWPKLYDAIIRSLRLAGVR